MITFANPLAQYRTHALAIDKAVARVLEGGTYILGKEVENFEQSFAAYLGVRHAVGVASGTDAVALALRALDVGRGDEVITVSHTAIATIAAILAVGATPVLVDVDPVYYTIDPAAAETAVTRRTKAIVAVHLYGQPADMAALMRLARRYRLKVVEDCAQAAGGVYDGRRVGSIGDAGTFSFFPTKNLGGIGDGGLVATEDNKLAERIRRLRQYGWNQRRETREIGVNSRLDPLQAAILSAKLPALEADNDRRVAIAALYQAGLAGAPVALPAVRSGSKHVFHLYVVACRNRKHLHAALKAKGIAPGVHYARPAHRHRGYAEHVRVPKTGLPVTDRLARRVLSLPIYPELSEAEVRRVVTAVHVAYGKHVDG